MQKGDLFHFIGIGGVSMSGIAFALAEQGFDVSGSDKSTPQTNSYLLHLQNSGKVQLFCGGHSKENINKNIKFIVITSTIRDDNPELQQAKELGITVLQRFECINMLLGLYKNKIGIFGGAGKTTTTALTFFVFEKANFHPSLFLGSVLNNLQSSVHLESSKNYCIFETDESDATFSFMDMNAGIFVAMEADHLEHESYLGKYDKMKEKFRSLLLDLESKNAPICYNEDSKDTKELILLTLPFYKNIKTFSVKNKNANFYCENLHFSYNGMTLDIYKDGNLFKEQVFMPLVGDFNALNLAGSLAMLSFFASENSLHLALLSLKDFKGIDKRQSLVGKFKNFDIIDDYAHSPLKISSMLKGFTSYAYEIKAEVLVVCEIHKMSRLKMMYQDFLSCFKHAKLLVLMDVYKVQGYAEEEQNMPKLISDIKEHNKHLEIIYIENKNLASELYKLIHYDEFASNKHNFLVFLGAGLSSKIAKEMQKNLEEIEFSTNYKRLAQ